ncbi:MAG: NepR family anti-sigma factor [Pseudomonadota bacterium]|nr:NepR family anti-sigma factor [Pseudomonadota bacterium]
MNYAFYDKAGQKLTKRGDHQGPATGGGAAGKSPQQRDAAIPAQPAWAKGLQRLYNEVVEEALPDDLAKLLDKLDRAADGK